MIKKAILLGRKAGSAQALRWMLNNKITVPFVVADPKEDRGTHLSSIAKNLGIPVYSDDALVYKMIEEQNPVLTNTDLVISYLYHKKIKEPLYKLGKRGCINFHPAPLPDYKSRAGYNTAILDQKKEFGVSAHFIDSENFDSGPIIQVLRFPIDHEAELVLSLERKTQEKLFELFVQTMKLFLSNEKIETTKNSGGLYLTAKELENLKVVDPTKDSSAEIDRKIRAFFFPPHHGAKIILAGKEYTLVNKEVLEYIAKLIHQ